ncbi:MAG: adenylate/guanylate cyclase domain-containing protein [Verrucomicrobia bacterium]|nr:MAG: adenylate/guanylate cyclase domain-containing protein [Verrucomicrobiota bacterium]
MERRLTAVLAADVVGYSRLMGADEAGTLDALSKLRSEFIDGKIAEHQGRLVKLTGDGLLLEFPSVVNAVRCAAEIQCGMRDRNANVPPEKRIEFRIGVNLGDVIVQDEDIFGDGVNVAARLESIAKPGGITISGSVRELVGNRLDLVFDDMGEQKLKNIEQPVRVYSLSQEESTIANTAPNRDQRPSIAVLPFSNMSGDPEQEYFSDGITEDIITDLSKVSGLWVAARNTVFTYKGKLATVEQIARELGVAYILEGSVRKAGARVRVTGQLTSTKDGGNLWADRFDRDLTDIFAIQDEITHAIVAQLKVKLLPQEAESIGQDPTDNVEAYTYYLRGRDFLHRRSKHYCRIARQMFAKAVALDPNYARAYAGMADCDSFLYLNYRVDVPIDALLATTEKALSLDNTLPEAHASRGHALAAARRYPEANAEFEKAIALDPNLFEAYYGYARASFAEGQLEQAARLFERASQLRRDDYQSVCLLIHIYRSLGRLADCKDAARRGIELAEKELSSHPDDPRPAHLGAGALFELGEMERAREWISRALAIDPDDPLTLYNVACGLTKLRDYDQAFALLERAIAGGGPELVNWVKYDSDLDGLRNDARYPALLARVNELFPDTK